MPVPAPTPLDQIAPPLNADERQLVSLQRTITAAQQSALPARDALLARLAKPGGGYTQRRLSELLSLGSHEGGGGLMTEHAVQRAVRIIRHGA